MTVIRHPDTKEVRVVIRGRCVRLKTSIGTYSYYHPDHVFTGFSWDALTTSLLLRTSPPDSILILGLGGGTIARQCRMLRPDARIVGVEIDPWIARMAREHFNLDALNVETIVSPAQDYLDRCNRKFDVVIDDIWHVGSEEARDILHDNRWIKKVTRNLKPDSIYSVNCWNRWGDHPRIHEIGERIKHSLPCLRELHPRFGQTSAIAAAREMLTPREARQQLRRLPPVIRRGLEHVRFVNRDAKHGEV